MTILDFDTFKGDIMSDETTSSETSENQPLQGTVSGPMTEQATGIVDTIFAETLGLGMHNAVSSQLNSQMTTSASVTSACARLLKTPYPAATAPAKAAPPKSIPAVSASKKEGLTAVRPVDEPVTVDAEPEPGRWYKRIFKRKKKALEEQLPE
jgi:hypothetical protein